MPVHWLRHVRLSLVCNIDFVGSMVQIGFITGFIVLLLLLCVITSFSWDNQWLLLQLYFLVIVDLLLFGLLFLIMFSFRDYLLDNWFLTHIKSLDRLPLFTPGLNTELFILLFKLRWQHHSLILFPHLLWTREENFLFSLHSLKQQLFHLPDLIVSIWADTFQQLLISSTRIGLFRSDICYSLGSMFLLLLYLCFSFIRFCEFNYHIWIILLPRCILCPLLILLCLSPWLDYLLSSFLVCTLLFALLRRNIFLLGLLLLLVLLFMSLSLYIFFMMLFRILRCPLYVCHLILISINLSCD